MEWTAHHPIILNNYSKIVISSNSGSCQIAGLKWPHQFYDFPSFANQKNAINEFITNSLDIIELYTLNMTPYE